jgi:hypothetical protein
MLKFAYFLENKSKERFLIENNWNKNFGAPYVNFQNHQNFGTQTSISFMGYLKSKNENKILEHVFNTCGLQNQEQKIGQKCLKKLCINRK